MKSVQIKNTDTKRSSRRRSGISIDDFKQVNAGWADFPCFTPIYQIDVIYTFSVKSFNLL